MCRGSESGSTLVKGVFATSLAIFAALTGPVAAAVESTFPLARLAAGSRQAAANVDAILTGGPAFQLAQALGGAPAREALLVACGYFSLALDVPEVADRQWTRALEIAGRRGDSAAMLVLTKRAMQGAVGLGDYERGSRLAESLRALALARHDGSVEAQAYNALGVIARRRGQLDRAISHQQQAIALFKQAGDGIGAMRALSDLGTVMRDRGDFAGALKAQLEATAERERSGDRLANVYRNLALLYREIEDITASRTYFQRALQEALRDGVPSTYASVTGAYSSLLNDIEEYDTAKKAANEALAIDTALGDRPHQGFEHLEIGRARIGLKDSTGARDELEQSLAIGRELGQRELVARSRLHLTENSLGQRDQMRARGLLDEAIAGLEAIRLRPQLAQAYALREQLARAEHDDTDALRFAHKAAIAREELIGIRASRQLTALEVAHARSDSEQRLAMLAKDNELQSARLQAQSLQRRLGGIALAGLVLALVALVWRYRGIRRLNHALGQRNTEIERQRAALGQANDALQKQAADLYLAATTDALTGVLNRGSLLEQLDQRLHDCERDVKPLALMLIDFDNFKQINDRCGHLFGDQVLVAGARAMRERLSDDDLLGRFGGEEFIVIACNRDPEQVLALAERLREDVASQLAWTAPELRSIATISIGLTFLADFEPPARSAALLEAADRALYEAKRDGRNRVRRYAA
jgi:diguanylate cyclase (GGDEF)-like protein